MADVEAPMVKIGMQQISHRKFSKIRFVIVVIFRMNGESICHNRATGHHLADRIAAFWRIVKHPVEI